MRVLRNAFAGFAEWYIDGARQARERRHNEVKRMMQPLKDALAADDAAHKAEITRLRTLLSKAGEALGPFGALQNAMDGGHNLTVPMKDIADDANVYGFNHVVITHGDLRAARSIREEIIKEIGDA